MALLNPTSTHTYGTFLDLEEVTAYLQMDAVPTPGSADAIKLQRFIDGACTQAQGPGGANRPLCPTRVHERHDGWSGDTIMLLFSPFLQLVSCVENMSTGGPITLPEATPSNNAFDGVTIDYATSKLTRTFAGGWPRPYFPGLRNIEVTYVAGFNPVPPDVWEATAELVAYKWRNSQEASRWFAQGDEYGGPATGGLFPGMPNRIADVLGSYRLPTIG